MKIREEILEKVNFLDFYSRFLQIEAGDRGKEQVQVLCPFHDDHVKSFSINMNNGLWKCFAASCPHPQGDIFWFYRYSYNCDFITAARAIGEMFGVEVKNIDKEIEPIDLGLIDKWHKTLLKSTQAMLMLKERRGFNDETIERFQLGWDGERLCIPIKNKWGEVVNVRRYLENAKGKQKMISFSKGYGEARLFPFENLDAGEIMINEGELDTMLACQLGYNAVTGTAGAGTWKTEWIPLFKGKKVYICYDIDESGRIGAEKVAAMLFKVAMEVRIIELPLIEPKDADFTDFIVSNGHTKKDVDDLILQSEMFVVKEKRQVADDTEVHKVHLSQASKKDYYYKQIEIGVVVSGKDLAPYLIPKKVTITCNHLKGRRCKNCSLPINGGEVTIEFDAKTNEMLQLIDCSENVQKHVIKKKANIPAECAQFDMIVDEAENIEEIRVMPQVDFSAEDSEYVLRQAFFIGHGLSSNQMYVLRGFTIPEPKTQYATHLIEKATPSQDSIASFKMTDELKEKLQVFQVKEGQSVDEKFNEIHDDFERNVTKIYERRDLLTAIDLIFHSVLKFKLAGEYLAKGWTECLILGDTRCVVGNTWLFTDDGMKRIRDCENSKMVATLSDKKKIGKFMKFKKEPVKKIVTRRGFKLEGTLDQPVLTPDKFVQLKDLQRGYFVGLRVGNKVFGHNTMPNEYARLLGYFIGDGCLSKNKKYVMTMTIWKEEKDVIKDFERCLNFKNKTTGSKISFRKYKPAPKRNVWTYSIKRNGCPQELKLPYCLSGTKEVPPQILKSEKRCVIQFLRALFENDGHHALNESIEYSTKSPKLAEQVQLLLLNLGIVSTKTWKRVKGIKYYRLIITGNYVNTFFDIIGFISKRKNKRKVVKHKTTLDTIPGINRLIDKVWQAYKNKHPEIKRRNPKLDGFSINTIRQWRYDTRNPQKETLKRFLRFTKEVDRLQAYKDLLWFSNSNISWDKIVSIRSGQKKVTYDLSIPDTHNFVANGIISHNCGKSASISKIIQHYKSGELVTGENASFAGLIGGMQEVNKRWSVSWGRVPLNDRRLVAIDETSSLSLENIERMSGVRSSGIAEIVKIQTEKTNARTRLIWLSNPRSPRSLNMYNNGIEAVRELIGRPEDIARFDFAITVASGEVSLDVINSLKHKNVKHVYNSELCNKLILWAWSRKRDDIIIPADTEKLIFAVGQEMGKRYSAAIPLVEPAEQRVKIARLAVAVACRLFSTEDGKKVIVKPEHVDFVWNYLEEVYSKKSLAYDLFSKARKKEVELSNKKELKSYIIELAKGETTLLINMLLDYTQITVNDMMDFMGVDRKEAKTAITKFVRFGVLRKRHTFYYKQPAFIAFLRDMQKEYEGKSEEKEKRQDSLF